MARFCTLIVIVAWTADVGASWPCSIEQGYPEVSYIAVVQGRVVAALGTYFDTDRKPGEQTVHLEYEPHVGWRRLTTPFAYGAATQAAKPACMQVPAPDLHWRETIRPGYSLEGYDASVEACTTYEGVKWGGISFYADEGSWGVGGLVKEDTPTGKTEALYPWTLRDYTVSHILGFDDHLWMGTTIRGECAGPASGYGIRRLDLKSPDPSVVDVPEVCGFAVREMLVFDDELWIATELGLARAKKRQDKRQVWENYVPDLAYEGLMRPVTCEALYAELLRSPRSVTDTAFDSDVFEDLWTRLRELRSTFIQRYLRQLHGHDPQSSGH